MKQYDAEIEKLIVQARENRLTNPQLVLESCRTLRDIAKANEDKSLLGFADYCMAGAYLTLNDEESLNHYAVRALNNLIGEKDWRLAGSTYNLMALMAIRSGKMTQGLEDLANAMKLAEEYHLDLLGGIAYMNAADVSVLLEDPEEAIHNILIAETYLDRCPEEKQQPYYYMIAVSEAAAYAKQINDPEIYQSQKKLLDAILVQHPEYCSDVNVLLLEYAEAHEQRNTEKEEKLVEEIKTSLFCSPEFLDYVNELMNFLHILMQTKKYDILDEVLVYLEQSLNGHESDGIMNLVSAFKVQYYLETKKTDLMNQELYQYWMHSRATRHQTNEAILSLVKTQHNLEVSQRANEKLKELADSDSLTALPNRRALNEKLDQVFELSFHKKYYLGVEMLDVDNFKGVNDTYGHSTGDDVLVLLGNCLKQITSQDIYAARYGGDEFVIIFNNQPDQVIQDVNARLIQLLTEGQKRASLPLFTISQGAIAAIPLAGVKVWDYTSAADTALYVAKNAGRNSYLLMHQPSELKAQDASAHIISNIPKDQA